MIVTRSRKVSRYRNRHLYTHRFGLMLPNIIPIAVAHSLPMAMTRKGACAAPVHC